MRRASLAGHGRAILGAAALLCSGLAPARAQLFAAQGLDPAYCHQPTLRQTVAYIDDSVMVEGQTGWALRLADKLRGSLTPGERVTVVRLSPASGQSSEVWSGCWPNLGAAERERDAGQTYFFEKNPADRIAEQQRLFLRDFGAALTTIYAAARRPEGAVHVDAEHPPQKQLLRALAADGGRFASSPTTIRAIVYSDMAENSDLGSVFHPSSAPADFGERLGTWLRRGVFYAYGLDSDVSGGTGVPEATRAFWSGALRSMAAAVGGLGSDLNVPNTLPVRAQAYGVTLQMQGQELAGRLSLLVGADGDLVDSWLGISRLSVTSVGGTFRCSSDASCRLDGITASGLATSSAEEAVELSGPVRGPLTGRLGVRGTAYMFPLRAQAPEGG